MQLKLGRGQRWGRQRGESGRPQDPTPGGFARRAVHLAVLMGFAAIVALLYGPILMGQVAAQVEPDNEIVGEFEGEGKWYEWYYQQRTQGCEIPVGAFNIAFAHLQQMEIWDSDAARAAASDWKSLGPMPITNADGTEDGTANKRHKGSGRVVGIAIDYGDKSDNTVYVASAGGGVWKTTDGGDTWKPLTDQQVTTVMGAIAVTRDADDKTVIYAATGEGEGYNRESPPPSTTPPSLYGSGVLKSRDGGSTWSTLDGTIQGDATKKAFLQAYVNDIAIHPKDPNIVFVAVSLGGNPGPGLYKSVNGGTTWTRVLSKACTGVIVNHANPKVVWAGVGNRAATGDNGVHRSRDAGDTFKHLTTNGVHSGDAVRRVELAMPRHATRTIYALMEKKAGNADLYRTDDEGVNWTRTGTAALSQTAVDCNSNGSGGHATSTGPFCGKQCDYNLIVAADPTDREIVYLGGLTLVCNVKGGSSTASAWKDLTHSYDLYLAPCTSGLNTKGLHADFHAVAVGRYDPHNRKQVIYIGNDGGIFKAVLQPPVDKTPANLATNGTLADSWRSKNDSLVITQYFQAMLNPKNPKEALGGAQDNGSSRAINTLSLGTPEPAAWRQVAQGDGGYIAINTNGVGRQRYYISWPELSIGRSKNSDPKEQADWDDILWKDLYQDAAVKGGDALFIAPYVLAYDGAKPNRIFAGATHVLRTDDATAGLPLTWSNISNNGGGRVGAGKISALGSARKNRAFLYVGKEVGTVYITSNGLAAAGSVRFRNRSLDGTRPTFRDRYISAIDVHPTDSKKALLCISGFGTRADNSDRPHVFYTASAGKDPDRAGPLRGWKALDGTGTDFLPNIPCNDVLFDPDSPNTTYYVATDLGIYVTTDSGDKWKRLGKKLPNTPVLDLSLHKYRAEGDVPARKVLVAATHGRGLWVYPL